MKRGNRFLILSVMVAFLVMPTYSLSENPCNPCAAGNACNPCGTNPCSVKNACNPCNPCAVKQPCQPCGAQPCQPCGAAMKVKPIRAEKIKTLDEAIRYGKKLWKDPSFGSSGLSCNSCHEAGKTYTRTVLQPYPHFVNMPNDVVTLDQMINFCMINPMKADPLPYDSKEMTALSAYFQNVSLKEVKSAFGPMPCHPCAMKHPCQPCAVNPCAAKNPCNPCNPCGGR
jgi:hypothetical protein